jgi:hypothetical protein
MVSGTSMQQQWREMSSKMQAGEEAGNKRAVGLGWFYKERDAATWKYLVMRKPKVLDSRWLEQLGGNGERLVSRLW